MFYIQLPYGFCKNSKQIQFNLPKNYETSQYVKRLPYITNKAPDFDNKVINLINNREDLKKWLLAMSEYGNEIQEDLNAIVGCDEKFNNAIVRHTLGLKDSAIFQNLNPLNVTFCHVKKFDMINPIIGKLIAQIKANKLSNEDLTKKISMQREVEKIQNRLAGIKKWKTRSMRLDDDDNSVSGASGGRGSDSGGGGPPRPGVIEELNSRLNAINSGRLTSSFIPSTERDPDENADTQDILNNRLNRLRYGLSVPISTKKFLARRQQLKDNEIFQILKGLVSARRVELFPDQFPSPPGPEFFEPPLVIPADDSFIRPDDLPDVPQTPIIDKFSRPLTKMVDDRKNTIEVTPKKPEADIEEKKLSQLLAEFFPDINEVLEEDKKMKETRM